MLGDSGQDPISDGGGPGRLIAIGLAIALVLGGAWLTLQPQLPAMPALPAAEQPQPAVSQIAFPAPPPERRASYVIDGAKVLSAEGQAKLDTLLGDLNVEAGPQVLVMTVPSLDGANVDDYARRVANQWGIGDPARKDGVLILVAPKERKVRIEVADGLTKVLSDDLCARIIREDMIPLFSQDKLEEATLAGADRLATVLRANPTLPGGGR